MKECWSLGAGEGEMGWRERVRGGSWAWREGVLVIRREERGLRKLQGMTGKEIFEAVALLRI